MRRVMRGVVRLFSLAAVGMLTLVAIPADADAQRGGPGRPANRARGERLEQMIQQRVGLSDSQVARLRATTRSYAPQRVALARRENALADSLRAHVAAPARDEALVGGLLDRLFAARRSRFELREREQRERAAFLTPSQRAMLLGLEEQAQRRAGALRAQRRSPRAPRP